jgi:hypothetical protein
MAKAGDFYVGSQLFCGVAEHAGAPLPPVGLGVGPTKIRGAGFIAGPLIVGDPFTFTKGPNINDANLMVARCGNPEALPPPPSILKVSSFGFPPTPIDVMLGDPLGHVGITINSLSISIFNDTNVSIISPNTIGVGILNWVGAKTLTGAESLTGTKAQAGSEARSGGKVFSGNVTITGKLTCSNVSLIGTINVQGWKEFDIPHPTKPNHRLAHACIEGPEIGVYYRGKLKDNNVIELPEYWIGLVDAETITVNLTPHGCYQELFVKSIEWGAKIIIQNNSGGPIDCSYVIYGKRKDVPDLEVEYAGNEMKGGK